MSSKSNAVRVTEVEEKVKGEGRADVLSEELAALSNVEALLGGAASLLDAVEWNWGTDERADRASQVSEIVKHAIAELHRRIEVLDDFWASSGAGGESPTPTLKRLGGEIGKAGQGAIWQEPEEPTTAEGVMSAGLGALVGKLYDRFIAGHVSESKAQDARGHVACEVREYGKAVFAAADLLETVHPGSGHG